MNLVVEGDTAAARRIRPARALAAAVLTRAPGLRPSAEKLAWRTFYELANLGRRDIGAALMNYGYAGLADAAAGDDGDDDRDRYGRALYRTVAGAVDLKGRDLLEVGCGRGGGTAHLADVMHPRSVTGLDLARRAVARAQRRYSRPGLRFIAGDAEELPFADASFDALLTVESTHCYSDTVRFLREARRVLRPGGVLLLADFRHAVLPAGADEALVPQEDLATLRRQIGEAGFAVEQEEDITANVVRALQLDTPRRRAQIERRVPGPLRQHALGFAAIEGSPMYEAFAQRRWTYVRVVARR
ncbi:MAG: class I SAM-dependent methyltransferase [Solirubrobacteraceae bacterium]